ncbi:membrane protein [Mesobacillus campisalis]|uniref:Membrane protein n=1 Tax=Mesobacillus campisalis TaxID=1408103 RepID=A0A0M2SW10_9BACI|nr:DUF5317 domain-containing protein [Mesobacillus campisalis]KKK38764.1 membrane protein [Mesobacillus campisalis]
MVFDGIILAFIVGFLRKGNLKGLAELKLKGGLVFPLLLILQIAVFSLQNKISLLGNLSGYIFILVYVVGLWFLYLNRTHHGFMVIFIGVLLNFLVMAANGGRMPVSVEAAAVLDPYYVETLKQGLYGKHFLLSETTKLGFLGDIIPLSAPYPRTQVISIGDIIMNIGIFIFIQHLMVGDKNSEKDADTGLLQKEVN